METSGNKTTFKTHLLGIQQPKNSQSQVIQFSEKQHLSSSQDNRQISADYQPIQTSPITKSTLNKKARDYMFPQSDEQREISLIFPCLRVTLRTKLIISTVLLVLSLFAERYCFLVSVYKTKYFGYVLILIVILLNSIFHFFNQFLRRDKHKRRLHEMFNIERTPKVGACLIGLIGLLDMFYAFFLFWPANIIPMWSIITLLQLFIPLNMFLRSFCVGLKHFKTHQYAALLILAGVAVNLVVLKNYSPQQQKYTLLFMLCSVFDVISHALKEGLVRSQPLNQEKFNFKISVSQFIIGLIMTPFILIISKEEVKYGGDPEDPFNDYKDSQYFKFLGNYLGLGFNCIFSVDNEQYPQCNYSFLYLIGYVISLFILQLTLTTLMIHKKTKNAKIIFSLMVPLTCLAFFIASLTVKNALQDFQIFDGFGIAIVGVGVFVYNWFNEKPQKASIENL